MHTNHRILVGGAALALILSAAACDTRAHPASPTSRPPSSAGARIQDDKNATAAYARIEQSEEPIWAAGIVTPQAQAQFARDWVNPAVPLRYLTKFQGMDYTYTGVPRVLSSRLVRYSVINGAVTLEAKQCIDSRNVKGQQYGTPRTTPHPRTFRTIVMSRVDGGPWKIRKVTAEPTTC